MIKILTEQKLDALRADIRSRMSEKRYNHTLGVEREISRLAQLYCPKNILEMRASALLHDITKEYSSEEHLSIIADNGLDIGYYSQQSNKTYHSLTASLIIPCIYSEFVSDDVLHAVKVHTTGCADMNLYDKLLYLADYIEDTRTFEDCVALRNFFWSGIDSGAEKNIHLDRTILLSLDMTIKDLIEGGKVICKDTVEARNSLLLLLK